MDRAHRLGAVAQMGERRVRNAEVRGSIPLGSITSPDDRFGQSALHETEQRRGVDLRIACRQGAGVRQGRGLPPAQRLPRPAGRLLLAESDLLWFVLGAELTERVRELVERRGRGRFSWLE